MKVIFVLVREQFVLVYPVDEVVIQRSLADRTENVPHVLQDSGEFCGSTEGERTDSFLMQLNF